MAKILIGNIKGPQGEQGPQGDQGPVGPQGPKGDTGPMPTLINNGTTTQAGVGALDAAYGKTLTDKDTDLQNQLNTLNGKTSSAGEIIRKYGDIGNSGSGAEIYANVIMQKISSEKCNIHIYGKMLSITDRSSSNFNIFDPAKIRSLLGISTLTWDFYASHAAVDPFSGAEFAADAIGCAGCFFQGAYLGRIYDAAGGAGGWPANMGIYDPGNVYYIDIWGASYA